MWWVGPVATSAIAWMILASSTAREAPSFLRHLSTGRYIAENGLPDRDPFTVLGANRSWANVSWLFDLGLYFAFVASSDAGLVAIRLLLIILLAVALVVPLQRDRALWQFLPIVTALVAIRDGLALSPTLAGMVLVAVWASLVRQWELRPAFRTVAFLCLTQALWANTAPTFRLGALLFCLRNLGGMCDTWSSTKRTNDGPWNLRSVIVTFAIFFSTLANPYGLHIWKATRSDCLGAFHLDAEAQSLVSGLVPLWSLEWSSPIWISFSVLLVTAVLCGLVAGIRLASLMPTIFLSVLGIADLRLLPLATVWLARDLQFACEDSTTAKASVRLVSFVARIPDRLVSTLLLAVAGVVVLLCWQDVQDGLAAVRRQLAGTTVAQSRMRLLPASDLTDPVLVLAPADAGWLVWGIPQLRPVLDDRVGLFANDYAMYRRFCLDVIHDRHNSYRRTDGTIGGWRQLANVLPFEWIVSRASDVEANQMLSSSTYWAPAYWDAEVVIFGPKQHSVVQSATSRLDELKRVSVFGIDGVPELSPNTPESFSLIMEKDAWRSLSQREFLELAKVYFALDRPEIAFYLLSQVDSSKLLKERDALLKRLDEKKANTEFVIQNSSLIPEKHSTVQ